MLISGCAGNGAGEAANNRTDYRSLSMAHCGSNHRSSSNATAYDGSSPAIVTAVVVVAVIVNGSRVDRRRVNISSAGTTPGVDAIAIPSIIISDVAIPVAAPITIIPMVSGLILNSPTLLIAVIGSHGWKTSTNDSGDGADRNKPLNSFHKCLRL